MNSRYSVRDLLLAILVVALGTAWYINSTENSKLRATLENLKTLNQQLAFDQSRLANCELELEHFMALANARLESVDVAPLLDAQRRKSTVQLRFLETRQQINQLLDPTSNTDSNIAKNGIVQSDIDRCNALLASLEKNPNSTIEQISRVNEQRAYFLALATTIAE